MAQGYSQPGRGLSRSRKALLGVRVALDRKSDNRHKLEPELEKVGVRFGKSLDPYALLQEAKANLKQEGRPQMHAIHVAFAAMATLRHGARRGDDPERVREVAKLLAKEDSDHHVDAVRSALRSAAALTTPTEERWKGVQDAASESLSDELKRITDSWCRTDLVPKDNEMVSKVETKLVLKSGGTTLDQLAPAVLPHNWPRCNDFFCRLERKPERDPRGATGGDLTPNLQRWRGVYEERVGGCPEGWFPDTFLLFDWYRTDNQIIMLYKLAPKRRGDRTVLRVDEGYIRVTRLVDTFEVSTVKYLLFDDEWIPGGGQVLGQSACQLGWLDHVLNQFTSCARELSGSDTQTAPAGDTDSGDAAPVGRPGSNIDAGLQRVLARCEDQLRESATDANGQLRAAMRKLRAGKYGLDDFVGDWGQVLACTMRDGARLLSNQRDLALESLDMANFSARVRDERS